MARACSPLVYYRHPVYRPIASLLRMTLGVLVSMCPPLVLIDRLSLYSTHTHVYADLVVKMYNRYGALVCSRKPLGVTGSNCELELAMYNA